MKGISVRRMRSLLEDLRRVRTGGEQYWRAYAVGWLQGELEVLGWPQEALKVLSSEWKPGEKS